MNVAGTRPLPFSSWEAKPQIGEPSHAYFVRLVREQDHVSARAYASDLEVNSRNVRPIALLDQILMLPLQESHVRSLKRWTPVLEPSWVHLSGQKIRRMQYAYVNRRFCRACLAESLYHRVWWDISSFTVCPLHQTPIEGSTGQDATVKWWWPDFEYGPDGKQIAEPAPITSEEDSYEVYLLQRLGVDIGNPRARPLLDRFDLGVVVDVCEAIGRFLRSPVSHQAPPKRQSDHRAGYEAAGLDEEYLEARFSEWFEASAAGGEPLNGLHESAGWFVQGRNHVNGPAWPLLQTILKRAFVKVGNIGRFRVRDNPLIHRRMTLQDLSAHTGIHVLGVRAIIIHLGVVRGPKDFYWFVDPEMLPGIEAFIADLISLREAAAILGCGQLVARELAGYGHLTALIGTRLFGHDGGGIATRRTEVERLRARALDVEPGGHDGETSSLLKYSQRRGVSMAAVIDMVLRGDVKPATHMDSVRGLSSWRFADPRERGWRVKRDLGGDLSIAEAAATIGIPLATAYALVAHGVLGSRIHQASNVVLRHSFEEFHMRYVNARLFQDEIGCSPLGFEKALARLGIERRFRDVEGPDKLHIVGRRALERALGIKTEPTPRLQALWERFFAELYKRKTRFALPVKLGTKPAKSWLSNRWTYVWFSIEGAGIAIDKVFSPRSTREWSIFVSNRQLIEKDMSGFHWVSDGEGVRFRFVIENRKDAILAAEALLAIERYFPSPSRIKSRK